MTTENARTDGNGNKTTLILDENDNVVRLTTEMLTPETSGDTIAPATNSADYIPQWDGADSKTLKNGLPTSTFEPALGFTPEDVSNKVTSISGSSTDTQYPSAKLVYDQLALKVAVADFITHTPQAVTITDATPDTGTVTTRPTGYHYDTFTAAIAADTTLTTSMSDGDAYEVLLSFSGTATVTFTGVTLPNAATTFTIDGVSGDKKSVVVKRIGSVYTGRTD